MMIFGRVVAFGALGLLLGVSSASAVIVVSVPDSTADVGGTAVVSVDITGLAADGPAGSIEIDLLIDGDVFDITGAPDCTVQVPVNNRSAFFPASQPTAPQRRIRLTVADQQADDPLGQDGPLWSCNFPVAGDAATGPSEVEVESVLVFDLLGLNELESEGVNGEVNIQTPPPATSTPTTTPTLAVPTATSTPTRTNTREPTATSTPTVPGGGGDDDDGCQVVAPANSSAGWLLLIPAAALLWQRRRSR